MTLKTAMSVTIETTFANESDIDLLSNAISIIPSPSSSSSSSYKYIGMYMSLPIFLLGVVGNTLTVLVMRRRVFAKTTAAVYLTMLAVADTCLLVTGIPHEWLEWFSIDLDTWPCRIHRFLFYTSSDVGMWTIVLFTFDRFVAVCFPLQKRSVCAPRRAFVAFALIVLLWIIKNLHVFWTSGPEYNDGVLWRRCGYLAAYADFEYYVRPWIVFGFIMAAPFCIVLLLNCLIVNNLLHSQRMRAGSASSAMIRNHSFRQTTIMCLSISFTFLVCIAPSIVLIIGRPYWKFPGKQNTAYNIAKVINNQLVYLNHAINFCLYCMTGQRFRSELATMFGRPPQKDSMQVSTPVTGQMLKQPFTHSESLC